MHREIEDRELLLMLAEVDLFTLEEETVMGRKKKHPILTGILILFILLLLIGALGSRSDKKETAKVEDPAPVEEPVEEPAEEPSQGEAPAEEPVEEPVEEKTEFGVGDTITQNDITVTLLDVIESKGSAYNKPSEGNVFVLFEFEIENNKSSDLNVSSLMNFECYCDDYTSNLSITALLEKGNKNQLDGTVAGGKKLNGVIGYEIPADWQVLEIRYTPSGFFSKEYKFVVNRE